MVLGSFGNAQFPNIPFGVQETTGMEFTYDYNFAVIPKLLGAAAIQAVARKPDTGELKVKFSDQYNTNPNNTFLTFKALADTRAPATLTVGGVNMGTFVITRIVKTVTRTTNTGVPFEIDCTISVLRTN